MNNTPSEKTMVPLFLPQTQVHTSMTSLHKTWDQKAQTEVWVFKKLQITAIEILNNFKSSLSFEPAQMASDFVWHWLRKGHPWTQLSSVALPEGRGTPIEWNFGFVFPFQHNFRSSLCESESMAPVTEFDGIPQGPAWLRSQGASKALGMRCDWTVLGTFRARTVRRQTAVSYQEGGRRVLWKSVGEINKWTTALLDKG